MANVLNIGRARTDNGATRLKVDLPVQKIKKYIYVKCIAEQ